MIDTDEQKIIIEKKVRYFFERKLPIHVSLSSDRWLNGNIKEFFSEGFVLDEFLLGEQPVFFMEVLPNGVSEYKRPGEKEDV